MPHLVTLEHYPKLNRPLYATKFIFNHFVLIFYNYSYVAYQSSLTPISHGPLDPNQSLPLVFLETHDLRNLTMTHDLIEPDSR